MKIAVDAMGGDHAPNAVIEGALLASEAIAPDTTLVLVGQEEALKRFFPTSDTKHSNIEIVYASQVIEMHEHPVKALPAKPDSSISVGYSMLKKGEVQAFCSAGNTGAMHVGAMFSVQAIAGISRPAIISFVPKLDGRMGIILDVGANTDCKPEHLQQFAEVGAIFCQYYFGMKSPKVALLNLGEEESKGNLMAQAAYKLLKENTRINFVGNIEGRDLFNEKADVIVCDGFVGNIVIKMAESYYEILHRKNFRDSFFDNFNFESIGGSPILGINGNVVIGHGISNGTAIKNMILMTERMTSHNIPEHIRENFAKA
jgi:glycerol-3-phosphate acyltransferase PlsX